MFERRLKFILGLLFVLTFAMLLRAFQLQVIQRKHFAEQARESMKREQAVETTRGSIIDYKGQPLAVDVACVDACVDYRAIAQPPDPAYVKKIATQWAKDRHADEWPKANAARKKELLDEESANVRDRMEKMWDRLASAGNKSRAQIDDDRHEVIRRVEMRRRNVWYRKYELATRAHEKSREAVDGEAREASWWKRWLIDEDQDAPQVDNFAIQVAEQTDVHPILRAISPEIQNELGKEIENLPGLVLRPGMTRVYPGGNATCHVVGHLARVRREDLEEDPNETDELRKYQYNDMIGRNGLEALCEPLLRGARGRVERYLGPADADDPNAPAGNTLKRVEPAAGVNVRTTIDLALQQDILGFFQDAKLVYDVRVSGQPAPFERRAMHGGAVVIDIASGEVRALVSSPTFDPNTYDDQYASLVADVLNKPLINRATQYPLETGSTIKPVVGIGAITQGLIAVNKGIECTGYMKVAGKLLTYARCWTASKFANTEAAASVPHHQIPDRDPHIGHDGNETGFLTFEDAVQRSCNVYFQTLGGELGLDGLSYWMDQFGLGRLTGIGIEESRGRLPNTYHGNNVRGAAWSAGIGQGSVAATPLQMANVAATIARGGVWVHPTLISQPFDAPLRTAYAKSSRTEAATTQPTTEPLNDPTAAEIWCTTPQRVALRVSAEAMEKARAGMIKVANTVAGSAYEGFHPAKERELPVLVAAKTGTAQAARLNIPEVDQTGKPLRDDAGRRKYRAIEPSTLGHVSAEAPWYVAYDVEGKNLKHSWVIGYAPADHPQVAFAVMVEYGGSGGAGAVEIARRTLDAAIQHGYLSADRAHAVTSSDANR